MSTNKTLKVMKGRPPWEALEGSMTWRKYGLRNYVQGQLERKKSPAAKSELGLLSGGRVRG